MRLGSTQQGFTYIGVLMLLAVIAASLAVVGPRWSDETDREREQELIRIGMVYARAIKSYYDASPGSLKQHPPSLDALLRDKRLVGTYRHMRRLYSDPIDSRQAWGLVVGDGGAIRGIYSRSSRTPLRAEGLDVGLVKLPAARSYSEWKFIPETPP